MDAAAEALLDLLPEAAATAMRAAFENHRGTYAFTERFYEAIAAIEYPRRGNGPPLVTQLTPAQHALAQLVADERFDAPSCIPKTVASRRRWLGLDPPGLLEQIVRFTDPEGKAHETPLWYALHFLPRRSEAPSRASVMRQFSIEDQLRILAEVATDTGYSVDPWDAFSRDLEQLTGQGAEWLPAFADQLVQEPGFLDAYAFPVFLSLVRAGVPIKPEWDKLLPVVSHPDTRALMFECAQAIPNERRGDALVNACKRDVWGTLIASILVEEFPEPALAQYIVDKLKDQEARVKKFIRPKLEAAAQRSPEVAAIVGRLKKAKPITLTCTRAWKPKSIKELTKTQQEQLAKAGKRWDGHNVPAARRLSSAKQDEQNLAATLELREIADAKGKHAYDAFTYAGDSGTIFRAKSTTVVAEIVQGGMECKNEALGDALEHALEAKPAPKKKPAAKKPAKKK